ncbi:hypothetical protein H1R20_g1650, partial [Candolleomyces eurysporus]
MLTLMTYIGLLMDYCPEYPADPDELEQLEKWMNPPDWEAPDHPEFLQHWDLPDDWNPQDSEDRESVEELQEDWVWGPSGSRRCRQEAMDYDWESSANPKELMNPDEWSLLQSLEPPKDWEVTETWLPPEGWDLAADWEAPEEWADFQQGPLDPKSWPIIRQLGLTKCEPYDFETYSLPLGSSPLSAADWAARWIACLCVVVDPEARVGNISDLFREVTTCPDAREVARWELALSWTPILDQPGYYSPRNPKTGIVGTGIDIIGDWRNSSDQAQYQCQKWVICHSIIGGGFGRLVDFSVRPPSSSLNFGLPMLTPQSAAVICQGHANTMVLSPNFKSPPAHFTTCCNEHVKITLFRALGVFASQTLHPPVLRQVLTVMNIEDDPVNLKLQTKITVWPKTVKDIGNFIKRAESLLDDLKIDLDAAQSK